MNAISFVIIASGEREESVNKAIDSIIAQEIPEFEILIYGVAAARPSIKINACPELVNYCKYNTIRNMALSGATYDVVVFLSETTWLAEDWYKKINSATDFDLATCRVTDEANKRLPDWVCRRQEPPYNTDWLEYDEWNKDVVIGLSIILINRKTAFHLHIDENETPSSEIGSICHKAIDSGLRLRVFPDAQAYSSASSFMFVVDEQDDKQLGKAMYEIGQKSYAEREYNSAAVFFELAWDTSENIETAYHIALSHLKNHAPAKARHWFELVKSEMNDSDRKDKKVTPRYAQSFYYLAMIYMEEKNYGMAQKSAEEALSYIPNHVKSKALWTYLKKRSDK